MTSLTPTATIPFGEIPLAPLLLPPGKVPSSVGVAHISETKSGYCGGMLHACGVYGVCLYVERSFVLILSSNPAPSRCLMR